MCGGARVWGVAAGMWVPLWGVVGVCACGGCVVVGVCVGGVVVRGVCLCEMHV